MNVDFAEDEVKESVGQAEQKFEDLKLEELTPLTPSIISRQATINIGLIEFIWIFIFLCHASF